MPGPAPRPLEEARRLGVKRQGHGSRPLPSPRDTFAVERIPSTPPDDLDVWGQMLWIHVASLPWVSTSDAAVLVEACQVADLLGELRRDVAQNGTSFESRGRRYINPAVSQVLEASKRLTSLLAAFGLTPADRSRLGIAEIKAQSKFEDLMDRKRSRDAG